MRKVSLFVLTAMMLALAACGGGSSSVPAIPDGGGASSGGGETVNATATLTGTIKFEGAVPEPKKIQMSADPYCKEHNPTATSEEVVVSDGGLENVIIYISGGLEGKSFPAATTPVEVEQEGCHYKPHVFTLQTGQALTIKNDDMTLHNVHAYAEKNMAFNDAQPTQGAENTHMFDMMEMPIAMRCEVHKWMNAFIGVFDHPFSTVSKKAGAYELKLPAGKYEITAWHEKYGEQKGSIEVSDNGKATLDFTFKATDAKAAD